MHNVIRMARLIEEQLMRGILQLNTKKKNQTNQVLNRELHAKISNQLCYKRKIITYDKNILNINQNIDVDSQRPQRIKAFKFNEL